MPEGDTIHRTAARLNAALQGRELELAAAPNPRSPIHTGADQLQGCTLELAEARGKHLLVRFSGDLVLHSHLGMNGRWWISVDGRQPHGTPWLLLASGRSSASQRGGKLRLVSGARARNDPVLLRLGPDPLAAGFNVEMAAARLLEHGRGREAGDALLDQQIIAGVGNAIRNEACFAAGISPWRPVDTLTTEEAESLLSESERIMRESAVTGRRPRRIYGAQRGGCPNCGGRVEVRGQGDDNRIAYWCPRCQR